MEDRRYVRIGLTSSGKKVYEGIEETMNLYFKNVFSAIPEEKQEQVIESLNLLLKALLDHKCCNKSSGG